MPEKDLEYFIRRHLVNQRWQHELGECGGVRCPWCDYERETKTGRFRPAEGGEPR